MPTYLFKDSVTSEIFETVMKISELEEYMKTNPTHQRYYDGVAPGMVDPVRVGVRKKDAGFKEVLQKIHERTPGSQLNTLSSQI